MIRTNVPSSLRQSAALAGVAGLLVLAGCAASPDTEDAEAADTGTTGSDAAESADYADGTYTADGSYQTPETVEQISVTLTLEDSIVTAVEVTGDPQAPETEQYQGQFIDGIESEVVGVAIDDLEVDKVAGSSLTSGGFNAAVEDIKQQASS
jgi:uncharacterized protein with FMN-binding domain